MFWYDLATSPSPSLPPLFARTGTYHRRASASLLAQRYFDQGLAFLYGFNKREAFEDFQAAARLDPRCAMAYWGIAQAKSPDINNSEVAPSDARIAQDALAKVKPLAGGLPAVDRALVDALARRFGGRPRAVLNGNYAQAMRRTWARFPKDPDVGALYADALLNRRPWDQWLPNGTPQPGTVEATETLARVLRLSPRHPMALHLTVHAWEASPTPERADAAADCLRDLTPALGHMVHMPSHIDVRRGRYREAILSNERAILADAAYRKARPQYDPYLLYTMHNYGMLGYAAMMAGQRRKAITAMDGMVKLLDLAPLSIQKELLVRLDSMLAVPLEARIRFGRWDDVLAQPAFPSTCRFSNAFRHAARGVAYAAKGDAFMAQAEAAEFADARKGPDGRDRFAGTPNATLLNVAGSLLDGETLLALGQTEGAIKPLRAAVAYEDRIAYDEPPDWVLPTRHVLGVALVRAKRYREAEAVYRDDLRRLPNDGWALRGLTAALVGEGRTSEAAATQRRFLAAWRDSDLEIRSSCLCVPDP